MTGYGQTVTSEEAKKAFAEAAADKKKPEIMEDWKTLKTWKGHHSRTISDVAWSPDNMHFASCSTDSTISIWNVNEHFALKTLECKANGLTFDPFGKFLAS
jgi:WD40 repeat protein